MKYIITESRLETVILKYIDNQDLLVNIKNENDSVTVFFSDHRSLNSTEIIFFGQNNKCNITKGFVTEIANFFSMDSSDAVNYIVKWVENKLQVSVKNVDILPVRLAYDKYIK
jgi:hypothetical protein